MMLLSLEHVVQRASCSGSRASKAGLRVGQNRHISRKSAEIRGARAPFSRTFRTFGFFRAAQFKTQKYISKMLLFASLFWRYWEIWEFSEFREAKFRSKLSLKSIGLRLKESWVFAKSTKMTRNTREICEICDAQPKSGGVQAGFSAKTRKGR